MIHSMDYWNIRWLAWGIGLFIASGIIWVAILIPVQLANWRRREDADKVREKYKDSDTIRQLTPLLVRPRERWITSEDKPEET